jgi:tetratricopeptide (TPR) repeat protein
VGQKSSRRRDAEAQRQAQRKPLIASPRLRVSASKKNLPIYLLLILATLAVYSQVLHFDFVNFDDPDYITNNSHVRQGITADGIEWALTSTDAANWFPVTRLSHMLDVQLFGLDAGWHHLTNVLFHTLATLLLFAFLHRATGARWPSAFVAFVFALHPLHVESVAWVAERKDVLSAFFWFLALWAYVRYAERPGAGRYLLVLLAFCLGLMSKPMIVTLPLVMLLLDVWPLRRWPLQRCPLRRWPLPLWEKLPFFALSIAAAIATYAVQSGAGAAEAVQAPLGLRAENALVSYIVYIAKTFWPTRLAVFYPYPQDLPVWQAAIAVLVLAGVSALVLWRFRTQPYLAIGWLWYLVTLVPVIGLVQVGAQARADRYTYVPMVGLSIMLAWGAASLALRWPGARPAIVAVAAVACAAWLALTWVQIGHWRNSEALFQHAVDVTTGNYVAEHNLGTYLMEEPGRLPEAIHHLEAAVRIKPDSARAHSDLGSALSKLPDGLPQVIVEYQLAVRFSPGSAIPHYNLGNALAAAGRLPEALAEWDTAIRLDPGYAPRLKQPMAEAHNNLGVTLAGAPGRLPDAIGHFEAALRLAPDYADAHYNLGLALSNIPARMTEAISELETALRLRPDPELRETIDRLKRGR